MKGIIVICPYNLGLETINRNVCFVCSQGLVVKWGKTQV